MSLAAMPGFMTGNNGAPTVKVRWPKLFCSKISLQAFRKVDARPAAGFARLALCGGARYISGIPPDKVSGGRREPRAAADLGQKTGVPASP
jgi:hypothetical protein